MKSSLSLQVNKYYQVVFVIGGPGSGKGTQCALLSSRLGWSHLSAGELLRKERLSDSHFSKMIEETINSGRVVPSSITVDLLQKSMEENRRKNGKKKFLIDGFPRSEENIASWNKKMGSVSELKLILFLNCSEDVMMSRLLERGQSSGRSDDHLEIIRKRFRTHNEESMSVIDVYKREGKLKIVAANRCKDVVYNDLEALIKKI